MENKKYRKYKTLYGLMIITLVATGVGGCANSTSDTQAKEDSIQGENTFAYSDNTEEDLVSTTITGIVSSIDGNEVTLAIGNKGGMMEGTPPDSNGTPPDSNGTPPDSNGTPPDSDASSQNKTGVLTIGDESVLSKDGTSASFSDITKGSMISITFDEDGKITEISISEGAGAGGMGNEQSNGVESYNAVKEYAEDATVDGESFSSTGTDENAILVSNGSKVILNNITLDRTSSDSTGGDNASFYGVGAGLLTTKGTTYVKGGTFNTDAAGGTGIFSYGEGVTYVADADIHTKQNTSGAIHAAGGGTLYAWNLNAVMEGESSAAIRSDRGGGKMVVDGGTYTSNGVGSPAVYCTADIAVNNATLTANGSEAICMEGLNSIHLYDCHITGKMQDLEQNDTTWTMIVYQSMSGDAEVGNSTMQIVGGSITSEKGGLLYTTNTESNILMSDVDIDYADDSEFFLQCTGNTNSRGWGNAGANGSDCVFTADDQDMEGDIIWDSISDLDFYMKNGSKLTGAFVDNETWAGNGGDGYCNVYIDDDSTWTVTADSTITNLYNKGTIVDKDGNTVTILGSDGTVYVKGNSEYTITVGSYGTSADFSGASNADSYSDYAVSKPVELN